MKVKELISLLSKSTADAEAVVGRKEVLAEKNGYIVDDIAIITEVDIKDGNIVIVYDTSTKPWINLPVSAT